VLETLWSGQVNLIASLLLTAFLWAWRRRARTVACASLAAAICLKGAPVALIPLFLTRSRWRWLAPLAAWVAGLWLTAALLVPAPHLTASFFGSAAWVLQRQPPYSEWNCSLSSIIPHLLEYFSAHTLSSTTVQTAKLIGLTLLLGASYATYVARAHTPRATNALFATCSICMVILPNIVWLHHFALLLPAFWILLAEAGTTAVCALAVVALLGVQCARCTQAHLGVPPGWPLGIAQVALLLACVWCTASVLGESSHRRRSGAA
jgi:hypothetical protein